MGNYPQHTVGDPLIKNCLSGLLICSQWIEFIFIVIFTDKLVSTLTQDCLCWLLLMNFYNRNLNFYFLYGLISDFSPRLIVNQGQKPSLPLYWRERPVYAFPRTIVWSEHKTCPESEIYFSISFSLSNLLCCLHIRYLKWHK